MEDIFKSLKAILYERISSPFSGALIISWIAWNWKAIYYLLYGEGVVIDKIGYLHDNYFNSIWFPWVDGFTLNPIYLPILSALFITTIYPFATTKIYEIWVYHQKKQRIHKEDLDKNKLISKEDSLKLINDIGELEKKFSEMVTSKDRKLEASELKITQLEDEKNELKNLVEENEKLRRRLAVTARKTPTTRDLAKMQVENENLNHSKLIQERIVEEEMDHPDYPSQNAYENHDSAEIQASLMNEYKKFKESNKYGGFIEIYKVFQETDELGGKVPAPILDYFIKKNIIEQTNYSYSFTKKGELFLEFYLEELDFTKKKDKLKENFSF